MASANRNVGGSRNGTRCRSRDGGEYRGPVSRSAWGDGSRSNSSHRVSRCPGGYRCDWSVIARAPDFTTWLAPTPHAAGRDHGRGARYAHVGAVKLTVQGRDCECDVTEVDDACPVLIGQV